MEAEVLERLKLFSLSRSEQGGVQLGDEDVCLGMDEVRRSLVGKVFGEKKANLVGVRSTLMKLWQHRGLCKVNSLAHNAFQFVFKDEGSRDEVMNGRPWLFDNQVLVLQYWDEKLHWHQLCFTQTPIWLQVWHIPYPWLSINTGRKIGSLLGPVRDVIIVESGGKEERHLKIQVELDLTKPLLRGTMLKYKQSESWIEFKYEHLPLFCFYCGLIGHNEKLCSKRKVDLTQNKLLCEQFGPWLRAGNRRTEGVGAMASGWRPGARQQGTKELQVINDHPIQGGDQLVSTHNVGMDSTGVLEGENGTPGQEGEVSGSKGLFISELKTGCECPESTAGQEGDEVGIMQEGMGTFCLEDSTATTLKPAADRLVDRGQDKLEEKTHPIPKVPLAECTNYLGLDMDVQGGEQSRDNKGKWKRRARLKGLENLPMLANHDQVGEVDNLKRVRAAGKENTDEDMDLLTHKKGKMTSSQELL